MWGTTPTYHLGEATINRKSYTLEINQSGSDSNEEKIGTFTLNNLLEAFAFGAQSTDKIYEENEDDEDLKEETWCNKGPAFAFNKLTGKNSLNDMKCDKMLTSVRNNAEEWKKISHILSISLVNYGNFILALTNDHGGVVSPGVGFSGTWMDTVPNVLNTGIYPGNTSQQLNYSWSPSKTPLDSIYFFLYIGK